MRTWAGGRSRGYLYVPPAPGGAPCSSGSCWHRCGRGLLRRFGAAKGACDAAGLIRCSDVARPTGMSGWGDSGGSVCSERTFSRRPWIRNVSPFDLAYALLADERRSVHARFTRAMAPARRGGQHRPVLAREDGGCLTCVAAGSSTHGVRGALPGARGWPCADIGRKELSNGSGTCR